MIAILQGLFDRFDALADLYSVQVYTMPIFMFVCLHVLCSTHAVCPTFGQKVRKTANEFYLVAAGLPNPALLPTEADRACGIAAYGFAIITVMNIVNIDLARYGVSLSLQVGIHSGSAIAGVIGHKTVQYDLCGDAVNTAARMCSYSKADHVHISEATYQLLRHRFDAVCRGVTRPRKRHGMRCAPVQKAPVHGL